MIVHSFSSNLIGLSVALGVLGLCSFCSLIYLLCLRNHTWELEHRRAIAWVYYAARALTPPRPRSYPMADPDNIQPEVQYWEPQPRKRPVGSWSQFSESAFPPDERMPDAEQMKAIKRACL